MTHNEPFSKTSWRKREDSNLRDISAHTISSRAPSTTRPRFHHNSIIVPSIFQSSPLLKNKPSAGNYYNYTAAIASNDSSSLTANYTQAPNSICPAGWRLPTGLTAASGTDSYSDYNYLLVENHVATSYVGAGTNAVYTTDSYNGFNLIRSTPLYFVRSGYVRDGSLFISGAYGHGWSSTVRSGTIGYGLDVDSTNVQPAGNHHRYDGFPVRCIAR